MHLRKPASQTLGIQESMVNLVNEDSGGASNYNIQKMESDRSLKENGYNKPINPNRHDSHLSRCHECRSYCHLVRTGPYSYENDQTIQQMNFFEKAEKVVLLTGYNKNKIKHFSEEAINHAVLDTTCTSSVCSTRCLQCFPDNKTGKPQII